MDETGGLMTGRVFSCSAVDWSCFIIKLKVTVPGPCLQLVQGHTLPLLQLHHCSDFLPPYGIMGPDHSHICKVEITKKRHVKVELQVFFNTRFTLNITFRGQNILMSNMQFVKYCQNLKPPLKIYGGIISHKQSNCQLSYLHTCILNLYSTLTYDVWMSQQVTLHLECTDLVAATFDNVNAAAAHDPIHTVFIDCCVS